MVKLKYQSEIQVLSLCCLGKVSNLCVQAAHSLNVEETSNFLVLNLIPHCKEGLSQHASYLQNVLARTDCASRTKAKKKKKKPFQICGR